MMRRVSGARRVIGEQRLVRRGPLLFSNPVDRMIGKIVVEIVVGVADIGLDRFGAFDHRRPPLAGVAAEESVEIVEPHMSWPAIERARLAAFPVWDVVVLAE